MLDGKLKNILSDVFEMQEKQITLMLTREDVDNWDSLKQMDLVLSLEKAYDISLTFEDIIGIESVKDIVAILEKKGIA